MKKNMKINNLNSTYKKTGNSKNCFVLLHGWGQNKDSFLSLYNYLKGQDKTVIAVDFPGFGETVEPGKPWGVGEYSNWLQQLLNNEGVESCVFVGHSFGCRVAIDYTVRELGNVSKLIMTGAAGVKPKRSFSYYYKVYTYKAMKYTLPKIGMKHVIEYKQNSAGSADYQSATQVMKGTLSRVVNNDLTGVLSKITQKTLLIFGENDEATPLQDGKIMNAKIQNSELLVYSGRTHYAFLEENSKFLIDCAVFLDEELESDLW